MRMVQAGDRLGFAFEPLFQIGISRDVLRQHLNGHGAIQARVSGLVDLTHPARAEGGFDLVGAEWGSSRQCHQWQSAVARVTAAFYSSRA